MTTEGMGWGDFDFTLRFDVTSSQEALLRVWEESAEDGSPQAVRVYRLTLLP